MKCTFGLITSTDCWDHWT